MMEAHEEKVKVVLKGGANIVKCRPIFSRDSKLLACGCGADVKVWSVVSGQCVHVLQGHSKAVTCLATHPTNPFQFFSTSLDGDVIKWDFEEGSLVHRYVTGKTIRAMVLINDNILYTLVTSRRNKTSAHLVKVNLAVSTESGVETTELADKITTRHNALTAGAQGSFVAASSLKKLHVFSTNKKKTRVWRVKDVADHKNDKRLSIVCLSAHPLEVCVATGMSDGKIFLWWNVLSDKVITSIQHWHSLAVSDLIYSPQGSCLLSGGQECVLVRWQHNDTHRDFLPRLGSPLCVLAASADNTHIACGQADNSIQVISNGSLVQVIQGVTTTGWLPGATDHCPAGLQLDPRSKALVSNGRPGHVQFYHLEQDQQLYNLDIVGHNYISADCAERPLVVTAVECVAFSEDGAWLATVERRDDRVTSMELRLKFWLYNEQQREYCLNTRVELPHQQRVRCVKFRPPVSDSAPFAVTTSDDATFKLWTVVDTTDIYRRSSCWSCESVGFYRDLPMSRADFSGDGSVLGICAGRLVTLWDPDTSALCELLTHPEPVTDVRFCRGRHARLVMSATESALSAWDLMEFSLLWTLPLTVRLMELHPLTSVAAVFTSANSLLVFDPSSSDPLYRHDNVAQEDVVSAVFVPGAAVHRGVLSWQDGATLCFMTRSQELLCLEGGEQDTAPPPLKVQQSVPTSALTELLTRHQPATPLTPAPLHSQHGQPAAQHLAEMLKTPAHVLPPVSSLCMPFIHQLLISNSSKNGEKTVEVDEEENDDVEVDMDVDQTQSKSPPPETSTDTDKMAAAARLKPAMFNWLNDLL